MIRKEAISIITKSLDDNPIISANGYISRDLFEECDKPTNFYMIGSMGLSSSIGLGVAMKNPKKRVFVFDGDGNILMNLGSLTTIGTIKPKNLIHVVFDNEIHESTGGQPTTSKVIQINKLAIAANYTSYTTNSKSELERILKKIKNKAGPFMILIKINKSSDISKRISLDTIKIKKRFMKSFNN